MEFQMDWPTIIQELQDAGYSQKQIAESCGCTQGLISQIKNKQIKNASYSVGFGLINLYEQVVGKQNRRMIE